MRVAAHRQGLGHRRRQVKELVQKFLFMQQMMGGMGGMEASAACSGKIPGMKNVAMARKMRRAMKSGRLPEGMGGMPGMRRHARHGRYAGNGDARYGFPGDGTCPAETRAPRPPA